MIKINLAKARKEKAVTPKVKTVDLRALSKLTKAGTEYYLGLILWLGVLGMIGYYYKVSKERESLKTKIAGLNQEKTRLQAEAKRFLDEKKNIEDNIAKINKDISDMDRSKDIIVGLKSYYDPFNSFFSFYTYFVPKTTWVSSYKQTFDINNQTVAAELEINSLDYESISAYTRALGSGSHKVNLNQLERKVNPYGFEYYTIKLLAERRIQEGR